MAEYTLLIILFAPFVGVVILMFVPNRQALQVRLVAAAAAGVCMLASFYMFFAYDPARGGFQFVQRFEWSKQLGIAFYLGVDGIGTLLVLASSILLFAGIFISWHIKDRTKEFYIFLLILAAATIGLHVVGHVLPVFLLRDVGHPDVCAAGRVGQPHQGVSGHDRPRGTEETRLGRFHPQLRGEQQGVCRD